MAECLHLFQYEENIVQVKSWRHSTELLEVNSYHRYLPNFTLLTTVCSVLPKIGHTIHAILLDTVYNFQDLHSNYNWCKSVFLLYYIVSSACSGSHWNLSGKCMDKLFFLKKHRISPRCIAAYILYNEGSFLVFVLAISLTTAWHVLFFNMCRTGERWHPWGIIEADNHFHPWWPCHGIRLANEQSFIPPLTVLGEKKSVNNHAPCVA